MELLGSYVNNLTNAHYQELLALLQSAIQRGDLSSGSSYDQSTLNQLEQQATSFSQLPEATAGNRVLDESINYPSQLLTARYNALVTETANFLARSATLIDIAKKETSLLDQLLASDHDPYPSNDLPNAWVYNWNFSAGKGKKSSLAPIDLSSQSLPVCLDEPSTRTFFDLSVGGIPYKGLTAKAVETLIPVKSLQWTYDSGTPEELYADDMSWTELTFQEDLPAVKYNSAPQVSVYLPINKTDTSVISVTGSTPGGALPTYVRLFFHPRRVDTTAVLTDGVVTRLSDYTIDPDNITIYTPATIYDSSLYTVDQTGSVTPNGIGTDIPVQIRFTENYPAYQCSLDLVNWSPITMLDLNRLYPDDATVFYSKGIVNNQFPITDETGIGSGLFFTLTKTLDTDYTFLVKNPGAIPYGKKAILEVDVDGTNYINELSLSPFSAFPLSISLIEVEGLTPNTRTTVWDANVEGVYAIGQVDYLLDAPLTIRIARQLVTKMYITFHQNNYTLLDYIPTNSTSIRREVMNTLQACLPFEVRRTPGVPALSKRIYQYQFGLEDIAIKDTTLIAPAVYVQDIGTVVGIPELIKFDGPILFQTAVYLSFKAYSASGSVVDSAVNVNPLPYFPQTFAFPFSAGVDRTQIKKVDLSLTFVLSSIQGSLPSISVQVALV